MPQHDKRTRDNLGREKVGDKLGKNKPKRKVRSGVGMQAPSKGGIRGTFRPTRVRNTRAS